MSPRLNSPSASVSSFSNELSGSEGNNYNGNNQSRSTSMEHEYEHLIDNSDEDDEVQIVPHSSVTAAITSGIRNVLKKEAHNNDMDNCVEDSYDDDDDDDDEVQVLTREEVMAEDRWRFLDDNKGELIDEEDEGDVLDSAYDNWTPRISNRQRKPAGRLSNTSRSNIYKRTHKFVGLLIVVFFVLYVVMIVSFVGWDKKKKFEGARIWKFRDGQNSTDDSWISRRLERRERRRKARQQKWKNSTIVRAWSYLRDYNFFFFFHPLKQNKQNNSDEALKTNDEVTIHMKDDGSKSTPGWIRAPDDLSDQKRQHSQFSRIQATGSWENDQKSILDALHQLQDSFSSLMEKQQELLNSNRNKEQDTETSQDEPRFDADNRKLLIEKDMEEVMSEVADSMNTMSGNDSDEKIIRALKTLEELHNLYGSMAMQVDELLEEVQKIDDSSDHGDTLKDADSIDPEAVHFNLPQANTESAERGLAHNNISQVDAEYDSIMELLRTTSDGKFLHHLFKYNNSANFDTEIVQKEGSIHVEHEVEDTVDFNGTITEVEIIDEYNDQGNNIVHSNKENVDENIIDENISDGTTIAQDSILIGADGHLLQDEHLMYSRKPVLANDLSHHRRNHLHDVHEKDSTPPQETIEPNFADLGHIPRLFVIDLWDNDPEVVLGAIRELISLLQENNEDNELNMKVIHQEIGGCATLVGALRKWYSHEYIQAYGLELVRLALFSEWSLFQPIARNADFVHVVLAAMKNFPRNEYLQEAACGVLNKLSRTYVKYNEKIVNTELEVIQETINAMKLYPSNPLLLKYACQTLYKLSRWSELRKPIRKAGGVKILKKTLKSKGKTDEETKKWIDYTLRRLEHKK